MAAINRRHLASSILMFSRNRRKLESLKRVTTMLIYFEERRKYLINQCLLNVETLLLIEKLNIAKRQQEKPRSCRRFLRNKGWWELVLDTYDDNRFYETFRMSR